MSENWVRVFSAMVTAHLGAVRSGGKLAVYCPRCGVDSYVRQGQQKENWARAGERARLVRKRPAEPGCDSRSAEGREFRRWRFHAGLIHALMLVRFCREPPKRGSSSNLRCWPRWQDCGSALINPFDGIRARRAMKTLSIIVAITATTIVARSEALDDYALSTLHWVEAAPVPPLGT